MASETIDDPVLGKLTWDDAGWWGGDFALTPKHAIEVFVDWEEGTPPEEVLAVCRATFERVRKNERAFRLDTAGLMVKLYNTNWRQPGDPAETSKSFASKLELGSVRLHPDGSAELGYIDDYDFFSGHSILASLDQTGSIAEAHLG